MTCLSQAAETLASAVSAVPGSCDPDPDPVGPSVPGGLSRALSVWCERVGSNDCVKRAAPPANTAAACGIGAIALLRAVRFHLRAIRAPPILLVPGGAAAYTRKAALESDAGAAAGEIAKRIPACFRGGVGKRVRARRAQAMDAVGWWRDRGPIRCGPITGWSLP